MSAVVHVAPSLAPFFGRFAALPLFVVWRRVVREDGHVDKVPISIEAGLPIDAQLVENRMTLAEAELWASQGVGDGVGVVITPESGLFFLDLDKCRNGDAWMPHAVEFLSRFPGAYLEVSQSGEGLHVIGSYAGERPIHGTRNKTYRLELYSGARFCALTGIGASGSIECDHTEAFRWFCAQCFPKAEASDEAEWSDKPVPEWQGPADDAELIARALRSISANAAFGGKARFRDLWEGNADALAATFPSSSGDTWDRSAADLALANNLVFWTGKNPARTAKLMRESALVRPKWERADYFQGTILKACADQKEVYRGSDSEQPSQDATAPAAPDEKRKRVPPAPVATADDPRPVICLSGGKLDKYALEARQLIDDVIYDRGGSLARLGTASEISNDLLIDPAGTKRAPAQPVIVQATNAYLRGALMNRAQFWKLDKRSNEWEPKDCPKELVEYLSDHRARSPIFPHYRTLTAISSVPFLRPDMSVCMVPGYDPATGIFYAPTLLIPELPEPTRANALAALTRLREPFSEFPYAGVGESVMVSHIISLVLRASYDVCPLFAYTSPIANTGKTLAASMPSLIASGTDPATSQYVEGEELRKVLFSSLLAGDSTLMFDNVPNGYKVRAPGLCQFLTSSVVSDRVLGVSEKRKLPNRCLVSITGNNVTPVSDLGRRSLVCRLDANLERARGRTFRIADLPAYVRQHRAQFIVDVLTIVRAYAFAGRPPVARALESFEQWSRLVRDPLVWLDMPDPVLSQETETDDEIEPLREAFQALAAVTEPKGNRFTVAEIMPMLGFGAPGAALRQALINDGCIKPEEKLSYWLRDRVDRVAGGWKLIRLDKRNGGTWAIYRTD